MLSCGRSWAIFFPLSYSLSLLEKVRCERSWLLDGTQAAFLSPDLSVYLALLPFIADSFFGPSVSHTYLFLFYHLISSENGRWWRYFSFFPLLLHTFECLLGYCVLLKDSLLAFPFCEKCCFCEWRADRQRWRAREGRAGEGQCVEVVVVWRLLHKATHKIHLKKIPLLIFISCFHRIKHKHLGSNVCFHTWRVKK